MSQKTTKKRISDVAYEKLRTAIIEAQFAPGSPIDERVTMELFEVGRTPLREALQRLVQEDLVVSVPQRGYFVSNTTASDFFQLQEFRLECEAMAARLAAKRITDEQLAELRALIDEAHAGVAAGTQEVKWHLALDERLHLLIAEASGNAYLVKTLKRAYALSLRSLYVSGLKVTLLDEELASYDEIHAALAAHDPERAVSAMLGHLQLSTVNLVAKGPQERGPVVAGEVQA